jgi:hypothetical protein
MRPLSGTIAALAFEPSRIEFAPEATFEAGTTDGFIERRRKARDVRREVAPPSALRWRRTAEGVLLEWEPNPLNEALLLEARANPLLTVGYRVYRWRVGQEPTAVATGGLERNSYLDRDLGPRGGRVFYSVLTVLEGRIGDRDTLIESERSKVLTVDLEESFELRLLGGTSERVGIEVRVQGGAPARSARFDVAVGDEIGQPVEVSGASVDFATGYAVTEIVETTEPVEQRVRRPMFNPDGSRARDATGFQYNDEVRTIPTRRLRVTCANDQGDLKTLVVDLP